MSRYRFDLATPDDDSEAVGLRAAIDALTFDDRGAVLLAWSLAAQGLPELVDDDEAGE